MTSIDHQTFVKNQDQAREDIFYTPNEVHRHFGGKVGLGTIYEKIRSGEIAHLRLGRKILVLASELDEWPRREARAA